MEELHWSLNALLILIIIILVIDLWETFKEAFKEACKETFKRKHNKTVQPSIMEIELVTFSRPTVKGKHKETGQPFDDSHLMVDRLVTFSRLTVHGKHEETGRAAIIDDDSYLMANRLVTLSAETTVKGKHEETGRPATIYDDSYHMADRLVTLSTETTIQGKHEEKGESSFAMCCSICMQDKYTKEMFWNPCCSHYFCKECIASHVAAKIQENLSQVKCPDPECMGVLEPHQCRSIISVDLFDRWGNALCENSVPVSLRLYCPYKNGEKVPITISRCPHCDRLLCAKCKVPWHEGKDCKEFQRTKQARGDQQVIQLAATQNWKRCPNCKYYVEKVLGCSHIVCRCGCQFCYRCGSRWTNHHACLPRPIGPANPVADS